MQKSTRIFTLYPATSSLQLLEIKRCTVCFTKIAIIYIKQKVIMYKEPYVDCAKQYLQN
jgi:hypothetical protein